MILVTGGAGYIGSHTVHQLHDQREEVLVLDDLSAGHRWAVPTGVELVVGDMGDTRLVREILSIHPIDSVIHFAAHTSVEESVLDPIKYYRNNFVGSLQLIESCLQHQVKHFIFSSTCAVYGNPVKNPITEDVPANPLSHYGKSKFMTESLLGDVRSNAMRSVILRYFNVAGARVSAGLGQATPGATQLIKVACEVACGKREKLFVFGTDYPTSDGTCIRDYIHVEDLANAHLLTLKYLRDGGRSDLFNCGYGKGYSVSDVIKTVGKVSGLDFQIEYKSRRPGDTVAIWADPTKIVQTLGWRPKYDNLEVICKTSLEWERMFRQDDFSIRPEIPIKGSK